MKKPEYKSRPHANDKGQKRNFDKPQKRRCPDNARDAAARLVWLVLDEYQTLDEAMYSCEEFIKLEGRDRGFAAAIAKSTLRYFGHIEILIDAKLQKPLPDTANYVRALLRTAIGQFLGELAPLHAIIDRAVELAKSDRKAFGMAGLVNAVLRKILTETPFPILDDILLLPNAWRSRLISTYGEEKTRLIARSSLKQAPIDFTLKTGLSESEISQILNEFGGELIGNSSLRVPNLPEGFQDFESWKSGKLWVQDIAASLPAKILSPKKGEEILDMCAAPGGKTMQLAGSFAKVTAIDISDERMKMVAQNLARTGLYAKLLSGNAINLIENNQYDAILLDAPCSATGTIRRNLESLWIKTAFDLPKLLQIQSDLLNAAAKSLKPNGRLVYAVCSLEPEEGDLAIAKALELGLKLDPITKDEIFGLEEAIEENGSLRIMPYMLGEKGGMDGFFIARFIKPHS